MALKRHVNEAATVLSFDPFKLLEDVEFPNDRYEEAIRNSKDARLVRISYSSPGDFYPDFFLN